VKETNRRAKNQSPLYQKPFLTDMARVCFVTGATGFVALNLVDELLKQGWEVHALHRLGSVRAKMLPDLPHAKEKKTGKLVLVAGDLAIDEDEFAALVPPSTECIFHICHVREPSSDINPARLLHAAGFQPESAEQHKRLNREAMRNVLYAAKRHDVRRVIYCSSWSSYGRQPDGADVSETTATHAHDLVSSGCCCAVSSPVPYFECKLELEQQLRASLEGAGSREAVIIQPCSIFGRYGDAGWCQIFHKLQESQGNMPGLPGSSSFVDAQDLACAFVKAADTGNGRGEAYIIGGTNASNLEMQQVTLNIHAQFEFQMK
jgi:nucleoside-diphosphate-sugar epimerase